MPDNQSYRVKVTAPLRFEAAAMAKVAKVLDLPPEEDRQPDLQYLTAIFVSTGINKNGAVFLGSELVKARKTIISKAVDVEHDEHTVIGHIVNSAFVNQDGSPFDVEDAATKETAELDGLELDIAIAAVVHKARFPGVAEEIAGGKWMVSMEAYYRDYDIKVGDMIIPRSMAEELGYDRLVGSVVQLRDGKNELGFHLVGRVLRDITFAGVGLVEHPANPRSVIMESAAEKTYVEACRSAATPVIDLASAQRKQEVTMLTREDVARIVQEVLASSITPVVPGGADQLVVGGAKVVDRPGTCVHYKRQLAAIPGPADDKLPEPQTNTTQYPLETQPGTDAYPPGTQIIREHHCNLFDVECSARPGDATSASCWRNVFVGSVLEAQENMRSGERWDSLWRELETLLSNIEKKING